MTRAEKDKRFAELSPQWMAATRRHDSAEVSRLGYLIIELDTSETDGE